MLENHSDNIGFLIFSPRCATEGQSLSEIDSIIGLKVNSKKTQMKVNSRVKTAEQFVYLNWQQSYSWWWQEINSRIIKANQMYAMLKPIQILKSRFPRAMCSSILLYGSECWRITTAIESNLDVFQTKWPYWRSFGSTPSPVDQGCETSQKP